MSKSDLSHKDAICIMINNTPRKIMIADIDAEDHHHQLACFLETFTMESFLYDADYRRRLNIILDSFTDEEFDEFESNYAQRFTLN